jgi:hypothetical protein
MEKNFNRNRKNLIISYNNVESKIIFGFVNELASEGKHLDYYVLDPKETVTLIDHVVAIKELFASVEIDPDSLYEENYVRPKRVKLPASEEELYYDYLNELAQMVVSLPQNMDDHDLQETVINTCREFIESLGYDHETGEEFLEISEFQQFYFKRANKASEEEIREVYAKGKFSLENKMRPKPAKESSSKISDAAAKVISVLNPVEDAVIRFGTLLIIKAKYDGKNINIVQMIPAPVALIIDEYPLLLKHPAAVLALLGLPKKEPVVKSWRKP